MEFDELHEYASFRSFPGYSRRIRGTRLQRIPATPRLLIGFTTGTSLSSIDPSADSSASDTPNVDYSNPTTATSSSTGITPDSAPDTTSPVDNNNNNLMCWHNSSLHGMGIALGVFQSCRQGTPNFGGLPSVVSRCDHVAVIELPGASVAGVRILLVHEFVNGDPNLSAVDLLRRSMTTDPNFTALSTWISRLNIAADVARGLDHIHNTNGLRSILLGSETVKSSSIIVSVGGELTGEFGDRPNQLGISPIDGIRSSSMNHDEAIAAVAETNQRSDVYAYGGLILELMSGEAPRAAVIEVARAVVDGRVLKWMWKDRRMEDWFPDKLVEKLLQIAVNCLEEDPGKRPSIAAVAGNIYRLCLESREWSNGSGDLWQGLHQRPVVPGVSLAAMRDIHGLIY
ncbi:unnamed protein product [Linum tenue]|uniref:Protein kinase domain-containing protein n=1 Tax=Linum tenue TaxID=586396 RepID=A0AAV0REU4_9ROSI|nr:unnamed protein product [Linum tenue]